MRKRLTVGALLATVMLFAVVLVSGSQAMVGGSVPDSAKKLGAAKVTTVSLNGWVGAKVEDDLLKLTATTREPDTARLDGDAGTGELVGSTGTPGPEPEALG